jgi:hypothetical protein
MFVREIGISREMLIIYDLCADPSPVLSSVVAKGEIDAI